MKNLFFLFLFSNFFFTSAQWVPQNSGTSNVLYQIFFPSNNTGYVIQDSGLLRKTTNGGTNWNLMPSIQGLGSIYFTSPDTGYGSTINGIVKTTDGGTIWNPVHIDSNRVFSYIYFEDDTTGYISAISTSFDSLFILRTTDGGNNWNLQNTYHSSFILPLINIFFVSTDTGFFAATTSVSRIYMTTDGGLTLDTVFTYFSGEINGIYFPSRDTGYAVGESGLIIKTIDGGFNWTVMPNSGNTNPLYSVFFTSNDIGYVVGGNGFNSGTILKTTDGGNSWINEPGLIQTFQSVYFPSTNIGYTCGTGGAILKYIADVGISENEDKGALIAYPNPTSGIFTIQSTKERFISTITIFNSLGDIILKSEIRNLKSEIDLSLHPPGIYFVKVIEGDRIAVKKVVKM